MLVVLGDIHFRDDRKYWRDVCEAFLLWFRGWSKNDPSNDLILAGDLVETSVLSGTVVDYLAKLLDYSRFRSVHICVGNHDRKKINNRDQLAYEFYRNRKDVSVYDEPAETDIGPFHVLFLPYYLGVDYDGLSMHDKYSRLAEDPHFSNRYDLAVGHFAGEECAFPGNVDYAENLGSIGARHFVLGHIHTRSANPERYLGSVFANRRSENDPTRCAVLIREDGSREDETLPVFSEFLNVRYPDPLPPSDAAVPIYTVANCSSEQLVAMKYGDIAVRAVVGGEAEAIPKRWVAVERQFGSIRDMDPGRLFSAFCGEQSPPLPPEVVSDCLRLLKGVGSL